MIATIQGQTIYYSVKGEGLPLVILHGLYLDSLTMEHALEETRINLKGFKRIYIDMPGMGQSPAHELTNNSDVMLDLLSELIHQLVGDRPFIVMGYSYGGYMAQGIAKKFLGQIIGEILICPVVIPDVRKRRQETITNWDIDQGFFAGLEERKKEELLESMVVINPRTFHRSEADFSRATALADWGFLQPLFRDGYASTYIEGDERIHQHKALIFLGYQDTSVGYRDMLDRLDRYPHATVNLMSNASHSFFLEHPIQFEHILGSWLMLYKANH